MANTYVEKITRPSRYIGVIKTIMLMVRERGALYTARLILALVKTGRTRLNDAYIQVWITRMKTALPSGPALTIYIPSYNRGTRAHELVLFLKQNLPPLTVEIEIIVVNNCSNDGTWEMVEPLTGGAISRINRTELLDTAEPNMFHALAFCKGESVWYHVDDDIPTVDTTLTLITMIRQDAADLYVLNSPVIDDEGVVLCHRMANMRTSHLDLSGHSMIETAGFVFMLTGISNVIFRRENADVDVTWEANATQPLYGHVCWLLACFGHLRTRIVNRPLAFYRNSDPSKKITHFTKVADRKNVCDLHFWGIKGALQLNWLVERGVISAPTLPRIFEGRRDGTRFKFMSEAIHKIYTQISDSITRSEERFRIDPKALTDVLGFHVSCVFFAYDFFEPIEQLNEIAMGPRSRKKFESLQRTFERVHRLHDSDIYRNNWQRQQSGYPIYHMACQWVAVRPEIEGGILNTLSVIDLEKRAPLLLIDNDFETLISRTAEHAKEYVPASNTQTGQLWAELERLGRQHIDLMHRAFMSTPIQSRFIVKGHCWAANFLNWLSIPLKSSYVSAGAY